MDMVYRFLLVTCLLSTAGLARAQSFEGYFVQRIITVNSEDLYEIMGDDLFADDPANLSASLMALDVTELADVGSAEVEDMRILVRGDLTRVQPETQSEAAGYQIINSRTGTVWMVNVPEKSFMEFTKQSAEEIEKEARDLMERMGIDPDQLPDMEEYESGSGRTVPTGQKEEINGFEAAAFAYSNEDQVEVAWCAKDTGFFADMKRLAMEGPFASEEDEESRGLECPEGTFPVRTLSYDLFTQELSVDDLVEAKTEPLPAALFEVPEGFQKKDFMDGIFGN
jgi:hypothetical protein